MSPDENTGTAEWGLVSKVIEGDDGAFGAVMDAYKRPILNFIYRMTGNVSEAEDIAQDVFVRTYQHITKPSFRIGSGKFSTFIFSIAHNAAVDRIRERSRRPSVDIEAPGVSAQIPADLNTPDKALADKEIGRRISAAVEKLPDDQKTALILSEYHDMSYSDIAEVMDCSEKSVESRLYRAKQTLRQSLSDLM